MRGRWAAGIVPRNFSWIIKDRLAVSERPGGYARNHRKVRRQEEILWLRAQHFDRIVSLLGSTHNLHAYDELALTWSHFPMPGGTDVAGALAGLYPSMYVWLRKGERLLLHQDELGDQLMGVIAGYLLWSALIPDGPRAITAAEQLLRRQMGAVGRQIVSIAGELPPPGVLKPPPPPPAPAPIAPLPDQAGASALTVVAPAADGSVESAGPPEPGGPGDFGGEHTGDAAPGGIAPRGIASPVPDPGSKDPSA
jgi:hypothetical protein